MEDVSSLPKNLIKAEMMRKGVKVKEMVELLKPYGEELTEISFNNKMARKSFSAAFFIKCMKALGVKLVKIED